jgi:hypothetical protein
MKGSPGIVVTVRSTVRLLTSERQERLVIGIPFPQQCDRFGQHLVNDEIGRLFAEPRTARAKIERAQWRIARKESERGAMGGGGGRNQPRPCGGLGERRFVVAQRRRSGLRMIWRFPEN